MAAKDYIWDSQAAKAIEEQRLDRHYADNKEHYDELAGTLWTSLGEVSDVPAYLKHDDLWDVLLPVLTRDAITLRALRRKRLPAPAARGGSRWIAWFTHYVTEQFLAEQADEGEKEEG